MKDNQQPSLVFKELKEDPQYLIYEDGSIYSKKVNKFLKGKIDNVGYKVYGLSIIDKRSVSGKKLQKMLYAHRLVAEYFIDNPKNLPYVNHIDGNKLNNHYLNLEWVSEKQNYQHYLKNNQRQIREPKFYNEDLKDEIWKVLPENKMYSISSCGRVRNNKTNRLLYLDEGQKYNRICLCQNGKNKRYYIHRLVYCVFNDDYSLDGYVIDHIDNNTKNNNLINLQKITQQQNCLKQERFND